MNFINKPSKHHAIFTYQIEWIHLCMIISPSWGGETGKIGILIQSAYVVSMFVLGTNLLMESVYSSWTQDEKVSEPNQIISYMHTALILESHQIFNGINETAKKQLKGLFKQRENVKQTHPYHWVSPHLYIPFQGPRSGVKTSRRHVPGILPSMAHCYKANISHESKYLTFCPLSLFLKRLVKIIGQSALRLCA